MWPTEQDWRASVPGLLRRAVERWDLRPGTPYPGGSVSHVVPVRLRDGGDAVLKLSYPHREAEHEAAALAWWDGAGAVRLLDVGPDDPFVLLLEHCHPGTRLVDRDDLPAAERLRTASGLLTRLWASGAPSEAPFESVADVTAEWAALAEVRMHELAPPFDPGLVRRGVDLLRALPHDAARSVVVHGDANPGNVLAAAREPWLVIDPKPMVGDPAYDLCPLLAQVDDPFRTDDPLRVVRHRVAVLADATGEAADRIAAWCTARLVESALWSVSRGAVQNGLVAMARAVVTDQLAGERRRR
ncbi:aminoglycoside phosphotransferase family protein [Curtobacterium sp. MCSS17_007]|uniref:aminoglycoside phosphotransferase family protein n=1 Tax=Curtobacterium sp. MCSS17_007 TaxID=2175646 RepID=UPI000DAA1D47|nr:aminoglycoside phosphotransferase family protein [Curtobacterium sp. MCSS17_007]WIE74923.1 aminoglycoside phosphotransferase family protein [Curtobacterium sp. MCSS17_007]